MSVKRGYAWVRGVVVLVAVGSAAAAMLILWHDTRPSQSGNLQVSRGSSAVQDSHGRVESVDGATVDPWLRPDERAPPPETDRLSTEWDSLLSSERVDVQRRRFAKAIAAAKAGVSVPANLLVAQDALSAMRPELYETDAGRAEHRGYEAELDGLEDRDPAEGGTQ